MDHQWRALHRHAIAGFTGSVQQIQCSRRQTVIRIDSGPKRSLAAAMSLLAIVVAYQPSRADPSRYPQFAQQTLPPQITPSFISIDELLEELKAGRRPLI